MSTVCALYLAQSYTSRDGCPSVIYQDPAYGNAFSRILGPREARSFVAARARARAHAHSAAAGVKCRVRFVRRIYDTWRCRSARALPSLSLFLFSPSSFNSARRLIIPSFLKIR